MAHSAIMSVRITGNGDDAAKAFEQVTRKASAFGAFMGGAALRGVTALWDGIKGFAGDVMDMSDSTQKFMNTMNFAGLDTSAVEAARKATRAYADATVYDLTTVQNTTAQLAANGVRNYTGLTEAAGNLNAVAGGNADTFKSVAMVLTQTAGAGKLTTENWNQLSDAIPGASGRLQEAMLKNGAYTGSFRDSMAKGEITADEFNQALMDLGMSDVAKEAATSAETMEGAMGNLEAAITGGLTDAFDLIKPTVTEAMGTAAEKISEFAGRATDAIKGVISLVRDGDFTAEFAQAFNVGEDSPIVDFLLTVRDTAIGAFDAIKSRAGAVKEGFDQIVQGVGAVIGPVVQFAADALGLTNNLDAGASASQAFGSILDTVAGALQAAGQWMKDNAQWLSAIVAGVGGAVAAYKAWQTAITIWQTAMKIATGVQAAFNMVMNANPIMIVIGLIATLTAGLAFFFTQTESGRRIWQAFTDFMGRAVQSIVRFFSELPGKIGGFFTDAKTKATDIWNAVTEWFKGVPGRIGGFFTGLPGRIGGFFADARNGVTDTWNGVVEWFKGIPDRILGAIGNVGNLLRDAGASIISGFLAGLKSKWDAVTGWIGGIGDWIVQHKGPPAYDARMLVNNGRLIMNGFARGLQTGFDGDVRTTIAGINRRMTGLRLHPAGGSPGAATVINVTVNGAIDPEATARQVRRILADYDRKRT